MKKIILLIIALESISLEVVSQARVLLNGGQVVMQNSGYLVIENSQPTGITTLSNSGGITTAANSFIRWYIGSTSGIYSVPYFFSNNFIPFGFSTSGATGSGYIDLNSYNVPTWKNSDYMPAGVTNVNNIGGADNSARLVDRFWSIRTGGYTTKPTLTDVSFGYREEEWTATGNSISESTLKAQRWNSDLMTWNDYLASGSANTASNVVTLSTISSTDLFQWWTLVDVLQGPLPIQLLSFNAIGINNSAVYTKWKTSNESNSSHFQVERSQNAILYVPVSTLPAAGFSSTERNYELTDLSPFAGRSYYRLKMIDRDGSFKYSSVVPVTLKEKGGIDIYPNPATDYLIIDIQRSGFKKIMLFNEKGQNILFSSPVHGINRLDLRSLPSGMYWLKITAEKDAEIFKIIKQ